MVNDKLRLLKLSIIYPLTDRKDVFYLVLRNCFKSNETEQKAEDCRAKHPRGAKCPRAMQSHAKPIPSLECITGDTAVCVCCPS